ncbi:MAG: hypothetical protein M9958_05105 [Chitinophagales bacterium]|nr:hypothetical protein [Chitinophagales bacterium]
MKLEYIYILAIVGYYAYKFFFKKDKQDDVPEVTQPKKKSKNIFEEILAEIEKASKQTEAPKPKPKAAVPTTKKKEKIKYQPITMPESISSFSIYEEGQASTITEAPQQEAHTTIKKPKKFGKMNMSPKEALIAQIILEKKF